MKRLRGYDSCLRRQAQASALATQRDRSLFFHLFLISQVGEIESLRFRLRRLDEDFPSRRLKSFSSPVEESFLVSSVEKSIVYLLLPGLPSTLSGIAATAYFLDDHFSSI